MNTKNSSVPAVYIKGQSTLSGGALVSIINAASRIVLTIVFVAGSQCRCNLLNRVGRQPFI